MSRNLGEPGAAGPPAATRVARSGWRDPRLWIGVLLVAGSVLAGARLLAAADDTVAVWAVTESSGAGSTISEDQLLVVRVRFDDDAERERYLLAEEPVPEGMVLTRAVGEGELLPRAALGSAEDAGTLRVPLDVEPNRVPRSVTVGSVVHVNVSVRGRAARLAGRELDGVTVVDAPEAAETLATTGTRLLVLAVPEEQVDEFVDLLDSLEEPVVRVVQAS